MKKRRQAVREVLIGNEGAYILIAYDPGHGILRAFGEALLEHARCAGCSSPLRDDFSKCGCGIFVDLFLWEEDSLGSVLHVEADVWRNVLDPLWAKDKRRTYGLINRDRRAQAIKASVDPPHTKNDIACLRKAQGDACYYCGATLGKGFHVDHLTPLARGGSNGFANIMLACGPCNILKHARREQHFWTKLQRELPEVEFHQRRAAAKEMKKAKWRYHGERIREARKPRFEI